MRKHVMISIDDTIHQTAKDKGVNISLICEDALREIVRTFEQKVLPEDCTHKWTWAFSTPWGLAKECLRCGTIQKVKLEAHGETMGRAARVYNKFKNATENTDRT